MALILRLYCSLFLISFASILQAEQDTIPPVLIQEAEDVSYSCNLPSQTLLNNWLDNNANVSFQDSSSFEIFKTLTPEEINDQLIEIELFSCDSLDRIRVGYYAIDSCNNSSDTSFAEFIIVDDTNPFYINEASDTTFQCSEMANIELVNWIQSAGNAVAQDACSDSVFVSHFIWNDNQGNSGNQDFNDPINIAIQRNQCIWEIRVSFFHQDLCSNTSVTTANFTVIDTISPSFIEEADTLRVQCTESIPDNIFAVIDDCDEEVSIQISTTDNRSTDSLSCSFYNYEITKTHVASDVCANTDTLIEIILVSDTLAPILTFSSPIIVDCDSPDNPDLYFENILDCSPYIYQFIDLDTIVEPCREIINRQWIIEDICGNRAIEVQEIQKQDLDPPTFLNEPQDLILSCSDSTSLNQEIRQWVLTRAGSLGADACHEFNFFGALSNSFFLSDTSSYPDSTVTHFSFTNCQTLDTGIVEKIDIDFVYFDECGNASKRSASAIITDTIPPHILSCPQDTLLVLAADSCQILFDIPFPTFEDNCELKSSLETRISINNVLQNVNPNNSRVNLNVGINQVSFDIIDCALNVTNCQYIIELIDPIAPIITCQDSLVVEVPNNGCQTQISIPPLLSVEENCSLSIAEVIDKIQLLNFTFDETTQEYIGQDQVVEIILPNFTEEIFSVRLSSNIKANFKNENASISILNENGIQLSSFNHGNNHCDGDIFQFTDIPLGEYEEFAADGVLRLNISIGDTILPCFPELIQSNSEDNSYISFQLEYSTISPKITIIDLQNLDSIPFDTNDNYTIGDYSVLYQIEDQFGNFDECEMPLKIVDTTPPGIECASMIFDFSVDDDPSKVISIEDIPYTALDNCMIDTILLDVNTIDCTSFGELTPVLLTAFDFSGNSSECSTAIMINKTPLNPSFSTGLCGGDTLKLFSNVSNPQGLIFEWSGPSNFNSSLSNPVIPNVDDAQTGNYSLSITNELGCVFMGQTNVTIQQINSPEISTLFIETCENESIILNSNSFNEQVNYLWFEGISPNGILLGETPGPSISLNPTLGTHNYYTIVEGDDCSSNPSNTIQIEVVPIPEANITNPFINVCEGDAIALSSASINTEFEYQWFGPDGFTSDKAIPEVINDASENQEGLYELIITSGMCQSQPALAEVNVFQNPITPIITGDNLICQGSNLSLIVTNNSNADKYQWYRDGQLFNTSSDNSLFIPAVQENIEGSWTVVVQEGICFSDTSDQFLVLVESTLNITASNNGPACQGDSVQLQASFIPNASYTWTTPSGNKIIERNPTIFAIPGTYTLDLMTFAGCLSTTSTVVEIIEVPTIAAVSNSSTMCMDQGSTIQFISNIIQEGDFEYSWTGPNNYMSNEEFPEIIFEDIGQNGSYTLVVLNDNCPSNSIETAVNVTINPSIPDLSFQEDICEGDVLIVEANITEEFDFLIWNTPLGQILTNIPTLEIPSFTSDLIGPISVIVENQGCRSEESNIIIPSIIESIPFPQIFGSNQVCRQDIQTYTYLETFNYDNVQWELNGNIISLSDSISPDLGIDTLILRIKGFKGNCESDWSPEYEIIVNDNPNIPIVFDQNLVFCESASTIDTIKFEGNGNQHQLYLNGIFLGSSETNSFTDIDISSISSGEYMLSLIQIENGCESDSLLIPISIVPIPNSFATINEDLNYICEDDIVTLTTNNPINLNTQWIYSSDLNIVEEESGLLQFNLNDNDELQSIFIQSFTEECGLIGIDTIQLSRLDYINANPDIYQLSLTQTNTIDPIENDEYDTDILFEILGFEGDSELSTNPDFTVDVINENFISNAESIVYSICYQDCPSICDTSLISLQFTNNDNCIINTILTPNNDGINDVLIISCLINGDYPNNELSIFNQWGDEVYFSSPYENDWLGFYQNQVLSVGTYYYVFDRGDGDRISGFITIEK